MCAMGPARVVSAYVTPITNAIVADRHRYAKGISMTSDRWKPSPYFAQTLAEAFAHRGATQANEAIAHGQYPDRAPSAAIPDPTTASAAPEPTDNRAHDACPELSALIDLLGTAEAAHDVVVLLIEVTTEDIADLDCSIKSCDFDRAALRLHRIVGGYQILGPSSLVEDGRALLVELRTLRSGATLSRLCRFRDHLISMMQRLENAVAAQRTERLLRA